MSTGLLLSLIVSAPGPTGLQKGDEITYTGTVAEAVDRPTQRLRRDHTLTIRVLVLDQQESWSDAAVLTRLQRGEDAVGTAAKPLTGTEKASPPLVRLDLVRVHSDGTCHQLLPVGPRLRLAADTPAQALRPIPLDKFAASELGMFPPRVPRSTSLGETWTVATGVSRPNEVWVAKKLEFVNAEQCQLLVMNQSPPEWERPVGGQTAWHRADAVWVSTEDGTARKVHRVILQRDGRSADPAAWIEVKYTLENRERLSGKKFDRLCRDAEAAYFALSESAVLARGALRTGPRVFEEKMAKLDIVLAEMEPGNPYREAIVAAQRTLEAARRGDVAPELPDLSTKPLAARHGRWPDPGQMAPNLLAGGLSLAALHGKPVVLVFFRPGGETTDLALAIANAIDKRYASDVAVLPLAVLDSVSQGIKDRDRLKFTVPVYDGTASMAAYGVESVPRFAVVDAAGRVTWTFVGVGAETGGLLKDELDRIARAGHPARPAGTIPPAGMTITPGSPRP